MDLLRSALWTRPLTPADRWALLDAIYTDPHTYYYPGWTALGDWLAQGLGWGLVFEDALVAALVAVPESDIWAWLRLFTARGDVPTGLAWRMLWRAAAAPLAAQGITHVVGLGGRRWVDRFFRQGGFRHTADLRSLLWRGPASALPAATPRADLRIVPLPADAVDAAAQVDRLAFDPAWRLRPELVHRVYAEARLALWACTPDGRAVGYVCFTPAPHGAHLARLAVHPDWQGQGVGRALVVQGLQRLSHSDPGLWVSVNTQRANTRALRLYRRLGFEPNPTDQPLWVSPVPHATAASAPSASALARP